MNFPFFPVTREWQMGEDRQRPRGAFVGEKGEREFMNFPDLALVERAGAQEGVY